MKRLRVLVTTLLIGGLPALQAHEQDAAAHKAWMDDAADLQDELREQLQSAAGAKAAEAATRIEKILARRSRTGRRSRPTMSRSRESRSLATAITTAAKSGRIDQAFAKMNARCNAGHDLHPEKR
jgi:hypothetical protein